MFFFPTFNLKRSFPKEYPVFVKSLEEFHFVNIGLGPADIPNLKPSRFRDPLDEVEAGTGTRQSGKDQGKTGGAAIRHMHPLWRNRYIIREQQFALVSG